MAKKTTKKTTKKAKPKRFVLGVGYPWFISFDYRFSSYDGLHLQELPFNKMPDDVGKHGLPVTLKHVGDIGNWNKIRLVAEVIK